MTDTTPEEPQLYMVVINMQDPMIMCPKHTASFRQLMLDLDLPHNIVPLTPEDQLLHTCHVCRLSEELAAKSEILLH